MELGVIILLVAFMALFAIPLAFLRKWYSSAKAMDALPGNTGWPFVGETLSFISEFSSPNGMHNFFKKRHQKYGKVFKSHVLGRFTVFATGSEASKMLLSGKDGMVSLNYSYARREILGNDSLLYKNGEVHKKLKKSITEPFAFNALKNHFQFINSLAIETLDQWAGRKVVFVYDEVSSFSLKVVSNMIMSLEPDGEEHKKFRANFDSIATAIAALPFNIPGTTFYRGIKARERMFAMLTSKIAERRSGNHLRQDFLGSLMKKDSKDSHDNDDDDNKLTDAQLSDNILTLLLAGHDTIASALTWLVKYLDENPHVLELLREEHREIAANGSTSLMWSDISNMPYTNKVLKETLRKATVLPWFTRTTGHDFEIDGHKIKKGWTMNLDVVSIHHDPEIYPQPELFDPSRFDQEVKPLSFLGFGSGPRACPGSNLAKLEISVFIHHLVCKYKWIPLEKVDPVQPTLVRKPKTKYPITIERV